jgi:hypothetical protein
VSVQAASACNPTTAATDLAGAASRPLSETTHLRSEIVRFPSAYGAKRIRTADLLGAIQALSQLSYSPATQTL